MNIPDIVNFSTVNYNCLCFVHAVELANQKIEVTVGLVHAEDVEHNYIHCDLCALQTSIQQATKNKNTFVWTEFDVMALPNEQEIRSDHYGSKKKYDSYTLSKRPIEEVESWLPMVQIVKISEKSWGDKDFSGNAARAAIWLNENKAYVPEI
jgi:hypothetical protein